MDKTRMGSQTTKLTRWQLPQFLVGLLLIGVVLASNNFIVIVPATEAQGDESTRAGTDAMIGVLYATYLGWRPVAGEQIPGVSDFTSFFSVAICGDQSFAGSNIGLFRQQSDGEWVQIQEPFPTGRLVAGLAFRDDSCQELYAAVLGAGLWQGTQDEREWQWVRVDSNDSADDESFDVLVHDNRLYYTGSFGLNWAELSEPGGKLDWQTTDITTLTISVTDNEDALLASVWGDGVYTIAPDSDEWQKLAGDPPDPLIYEAAGNSLGVIAGTQNGLLFAGGDDDWMEVTAVQPARTTFAAIADGQRLYAGQRGPYVFYTEDGQTWGQLPRFPDLRPDGEQGFQVRGFSVGLTDGALYAATTSGVWRLVGEGLP